MISKILLPFLLLPVLVFSQPYTSYLTGDSSDVTTAHEPGLVLMGGATENDAAMVWFLERAAGGDVVVLRADNSSGYQNYLYSQLGVSVNSVQTLVVNSTSGANDPYVIAQIQNAEALWLAGGDQWDYISDWKDSPVEDAINFLINTKQATVGGTSAGCMILGDWYFSAQNGTITSTQALNNPYSNYATLEHGEFLNHEYLASVITDTHFDNPDRRGRLFTFLARMVTDEAINAKGIGIDEYTAVCIDENGMGHIYGEYPQYDDYVYFLQSNCIPPIEPETCAPSQKLTWDRSQQAVKVYKVPGNFSGSNTFNLLNWEDGTGGEWWNWYAIDGTMSYVGSASPADCYTTGGDDVKNIFGAIIVPNIIQDYGWIYWKSGFQNLPASEMELIDAWGRTIDRYHSSESPLQLNMNSLPSGIYFLKCGNEFLKVVKTN